MDYLEQNHYHHHGYTSRYIDELYYHLELDQLDLHLSEFTEHLNQVDRISYISEDKLP
jgi:hypothetical protein